MMVIQKFWEQLAPTWYISGWWQLKICLLFHPWGDDPIWRLHMFQMVWGTNHQLDLNISWAIGPQSMDGFASPLGLEMMLIYLRTLVFHTHGFKPWCRTNEELQDIKLHCWFGKCLFLVQKSFCQVIIVKCLKFYWVEVQFEDQGYMTCSCQFLDNDLECFGELCFVMLLKWMNTNFANNKNYTQHC